MAYDVTKLITLGQLRSLAQKAHADDKAIIGANTDASAAITVYGARALADTKVASLTASNNGVEIGGTATAPTVGLKLSAKTGNELSIETGTGEEGLYFKSPAAPVITVQQKAAANTGYLKTYQVCVDGNPVAVDIDIPKDYLVKAAEIKTVTTADDPYSGAVVGEKYIDFTINTVGDDGTASHIYLPVADLAHVYSAGNGIAISASDEISLVIDSANANGLSVGASGLALAPVVASTSGTGGSNGAMTAAQAEKLAGISTGANKVEASTTNGNIKIDGTETTVYNLALDTATDAEVSEMIAEAFSA